MTYHELCAFILIEVYGDVKMYVGNENLYTFILQSSKATLVEHVIFKSFKVKKACCVE